MLGCLREGILQRGAAVTHGVPADLLRAVQVPQRHIVEAVEQAGTHAVHPTHRDFLALAAGSPGYELVRQQHIAAGRVAGAVPQHAGNGVIVTLNGLFRPDVPHHGGLEEGQQIDIHRAVLIGEGNGHRCAGKHRADIDSAARQQGRAERDAVGGIVVAADGEYRQLPGGKLGQKPVQ